MWKRRIVMGLLVLGTVLGFASGFRHMSGRGGCRGERGRHPLVTEVAEACVDAARRTPPAALAPATREAR